MKKWAILLLCMLFAAGPFANDLFAQALPPMQPEQDACNAIELCGLTFMTPYSYSGYGQKMEYSQGGPNLGCFNETNSVWLRFRVATAGNIVFKIIPQDSTDDYDYSVFDITQHYCNAVLNTSPVRCNGNTIFPIGTIPAGIVGLNMTSTLVNVPAGTIGNPFCQFITATPGQQFLILVDNFSASAAGFTIDFTGTTATFVQGPKPVLAEIIPACNKSESINIRTSKLVKCSSIASDGSDFFLTPNGTISSATGLNCSTPNGYTDQIELQFASPLALGNCVVNAKTGTDGNTLLDLCNNALLAPDTLHFTVDSLIDPAITRLDTPACARARVILNHSIRNSTVAYDGSDFKINGPGPVSVIKAIPIAANLSPYADAIDLFFNKSIEVPGNYTLSVVTGSDGDKVLDICGLSVVNTISWDVSDQGYVVASAVPAALCKEGYVDLSATVAEGCYGPVWLDSYMLGNDTIFNTQAYANATNIYKVQVYDSNSCYRRDTAMVVVFNDCVDTPIVKSPPFFIPSAFTPNGDGKNDFFHVSNLSARRISEFRVFNRWGQEVFRTSGKDKGWDGTCNGVAQPVDVYYYIITVASFDGHSDTFKGDVTLVR
ncbi:gliding motility-associated C-terminal domain-containing protein [Taibaiella soli]|uniref:Gliding motility-associated C-terminal domain-containing protein n=1 Tax=Taibaiella soli TaxID=1649169 RepID=A0A2W2C1D7_9BACT|nr:gliding motility-associated C-terminal domain-containing protein [Taibaiella soli]PZF73853.1 hypothetical protein DN068_05795 [Taibaiella soli]